VRGMGEPPRGDVISDSDRTAITALVAGADSSQGDVDALMALHTQDTVIVNLAGRRVLGRTAFEGAMREALGGPLSRVRTRVEVLDVRAVTTDVALVSCLKSIVDERQDGAVLPSSSGALTYVVRRGDEAWEIALAQTTPVLAG
jgi:uncharacterized protein (TIGR02246 family)